MTELEIIRNDSLNRFEISIDGATAMLTFKRAPGQITLIHTEVPNQFEGKGIGGHLARAALRFAQSKNLTVVPRCAFVACYIERHPEYASLVKAS